jgi:hypothetical protein
MEEGDSSGSAARAFTAKKNKKAAGPREKIDDDDEGETLKMTTMR